MDLVANNLSYKPDDQYHLNEVSFNFKEGNLYTILGRTLSGKTTLLKTIAGLLTPDSGEIDPMDVSPIYVRAAKRQQSKALYFKSIYTVMEGDSLDFLGHLFNCEKQHLMMWNQLTNTTLMPGQELMIYYPSKIVRYRPQQKTDLTFLPSLPLAEVNSRTPKRNSQNQKIEAQPQSFIYHRLKRYESLKEVAEKYEGVTVTEIMGWNNFTKKTMPRTGENIKIFVR